MMLILDVRAELSFAELSCAVQLLCCTALVLLNDDDALDFVYEMSTLVRSIKNACSRTDNLGESERRIDGTHGLSRIHQDVLAKSALI